MTKLDDGGRHAVQRGWWPKGDTELPVNDVYIWTNLDMWGYSLGTRIAIQIGTEGKDNPDYDPIWFQPDAVIFEKIEEE